MNYFELYPGDYLRDTTRLTLVEHGAYLRLLMTYYAEEQPLPSDDAELFVIVSAVTPADKAAVRKVADRFFPIFPDGLRHSVRADKEILSRAKKMARIADLRARDEYRQHRDFVLQRDGHACVYCGATDVPLHLDHVVPSSRGGSDDPSNLVAACRPCNCSKGPRTPEEWMGRGP